MTRATPAGLLTFFAMAFAVPWFGWLVVRNDTLSLWLFPLAASLAGFAAAFVDGGREGVAGFARRVFRIRGTRGCIAAALALPIVLGGTYLLVMGQVHADIVVSPASILALSLGSALVTGPLAEEFGWRGYLQPTLLRRLAPFWAALLVGLIWWIWHFALYRGSVFADPQLALRFLAYLETWSIFAMFLVQRSGGSVWPAVALHWAANTHADVLRVALPSIDSGALPGGSKGWLYYLLAACAFALIKRRFYFGRPRSTEVHVDGAPDGSPPTPGKRVGLDRVRS